jgi:16S rRNA G966 N2-methylase RsmD/DNA-directed RNA polymerase subunit RPC12/RpoP
MHLAARPQDNVPIDDSFAHDVRAGKNTDIYDAHTYHTKVPPQGITPFIEHYTHPGELVLDPFCGSGMVGLAALTARRKALLIDLSPAAACIAYNFCQPVDAIAFERAIEDMLTYVRPEATYVYQTQCRICGGSAEMLYTVWSYRYVCPRCNQPFVYAEYALDKEGRIQRSFPCPHCGQPFDKKHGQRLDITPVLIGYRCAAGCRRGRRILQDPVSETDLRLLREIEDRGLPERLWYPTDELFPGYNTRQPIAAGLTRVDQFYTTRNLWVLARMWEFASHYPDLPLRAKLCFVLTSLYKRITKFSEYRFWGGSGNTANWYVPAIINEQNVCEVVRRKAREIGKFLAYTRTNADFQEFRVSVQSATDLSNIPDNNVDYIFTDPPFGGNINYSEMNLLWEAWLQVSTERGEEAIVNRVQGKSVDDYRRLMTAALKEAYRVLRPGRWMTLVFHNSSERVWRAIQTAIVDAGFRVGSVHVFDKRQETVKQAVSRNAVGYDLVINCQKTAAPVTDYRPLTDIRSEVCRFLVAHLQSLSSDDLTERDERKLFSRVLGHFLANHYTIDLSFAQFRKLLSAGYENRAGYWYLRDETIVASSVGVDGPLTGGYHNVYLSAAAQALSEAGTPLHTRDVFQRAIEAGLLDPNRHSRENLLATLSSETSADSSPHFVRVSRGRYALKPTT